MDGDGNETAAPVAAQMSQVELIEQRNAAFTADAAKHAAEKERVRQQEREDQMDCDQADWYEKRGDARRTGQGVGYGHFDSDLSNADFPAERWGRNYMDKDAFGQKRWTPKAEDMWEDNLAGSRKAARDEGGCYTEAVQG